MLEIPIEDSTVKTCKEGCVTEYIDSVDVPVEEPKVK
jgi:hypothetical protein